MSEARSSNDEGFLRDKKGSSARSLLQHSQQRADKASFNTLEIDHFQLDDLISSKSTGSSKSHVYQTKAPKDIYSQMHKWSRRARSKVVTGFNDHAYFDDSESPSSSQFSAKLMPMAKHYIVQDIDDSEMEALQEGNEQVEWNSYCVRTLKENTLNMVKRSQELGISNKVFTIIRYRSKVIVLTKSLNYMRVPLSSVKVQWRFSRFLAAPGFFMLFYMLNRYGSVVTLMKLTFNSALCVFETIQDAARAVNMTSAKQSMELLILSWWYQNIGSLSCTSGSTLSRQLMGTQWLETVCAGLEAQDTGSKKHSFAQYRKTGIRDLPKQRALELPSLKTRSYPNLRSKDGPHRTSKRK